jgi:hypothetical protein
LCSSFVTIDHFRSTYFRLNNEANLTIVKTLKAAVKELRARCTVYSTLRASQTRPRISYAELTKRNRPAHLANAMLYHDHNPGYAGPGMVSLDCEGTLTLSRDIPQMVLSLKIYYVYEVNPLWNIPLRTVTDLKSWLDRQFLASREITPIPKLNQRAITTLSSIWELLTQFQTNIYNRSVLVRATPTDLEDRIAIVEASVIAEPPPTPAMKTPEAARQRLIDSSQHVSYLGYQIKRTVADVGNEGKLYPQKADMSLLCENQAQQAEITRLTCSTKRYGRRMRVANNNIRTLRNELRDSRNQNSELQDRLDKAEHEAGGLFPNYARDEVSLSPSLNQQWTWFAFVIVLLIRKHLQSLHDY